jgi:hypothetical protein
MSANISPLGPLITAIRPTPGMSNGSRETVAPSNVAFFTAASVSSTAKYVTHTLGISAGNSSPIASTPATPRSFTLKMT